MSGPCPICEKLMNTSWEDSPFTYTSGVCLHCGFYYQPETGRQSFTCLNDARNQAGLSLLTWKEYFKIGKGKEFNIA